MLVSLPVAAALLHAPAAFASNGSIVLDYSWLHHDDGGIPAPYEESPFDPNSLTLNGTTSVLQALLEDVNDNVAITLMPQWTKSSFPAQFVGQVAFQFNQPAASVAIDSCTPAPSISSVNCGAVELRPNGPVTGGGNDTGNLNLVVNLPKSFKNPANGRLEGADEMLRLVFKSKNGNPISINNFISPTPQDSNPFYSCAHIQGINNLGGKDASQSVCVTSLENPEEPKEPSDVPSPLAILGVAAAFRASRQLRQRRTLSGLKVTAMAAAERQLA